VNTTGKWLKLKRGLRKREYWIGVLGIVLTAAVAIAVVYFWENVRALGGYGYMGAFIVGVLGGATYIAPVPMTPVVFALGTVLKPSFAPYLGPVFVGAAAGLGESVGGLTIYMTGYGGGTALVSSKHTKIQAAYSRVLHWMEWRGSLVLFIFSAVLNPFFYPVGLAAGALRFGIKRYFFICWAGKTIKGITVAAVGYWGLGSLLRMLGVPV